ncbi:MAG: porin [Alphaproteobacteria bacterium]|nr:porin [Alphaproteobacteria bacterium]
MKKLLLASTALVGASMLAAGPAAAGPVTSGNDFDLTLGGMIRVSAYGVSQDISSGLNPLTGAAITGTTSSGRGYRMYHPETEVWVKGSKKGDNGLTYGFEIELNAASTDATTSDESWIFVSSDTWGRVEMGDQDDAGNRMTIDPGTSAVLKGNGGFYGGIGVQQWFNFGTEAAGQGVSPTRIDLEVSYEGGASDATKVIYFTPRFAGFQLGAAFTPDGGQGGFTRDADNDGDFEEIINLAANYVGTMGDVGVSIGGAWWGGKGEVAAPVVGTANTTNDMVMWRAGAKMDFAGFSVSAAYMDLGRTGVTTANSDLGADSGDYWTAGIGYTTGPWGVSVGYYDSQKSRGTGVAVNAREFKLSWLAFGASYAVAPGWSLLADMSFIDATNIAGTSFDNDGHVFGLTSNFTF